jgi:hypothetical protein
MLTPATLEKRLRDISNLVKLKIKKLKSSYALVTYENGAYTITIPPDQDDDYNLRTFLHELVHIACGPELSPWGTPFQEAFLERCIEPMMIQHIIANPTRHRWWLKRLKAISNAN